jgi:DNA-directed RNA polymerase subunit H
MPHLRSDCSFVTLRFVGLSKKEVSLEERKAEVLIKLRGYKLVKKQKHEDAVGYIVDIPKLKEKALVWCVPGEATVGVASIARLQKAMKDAEVEKGIIVTDGRYTHAVKQGAKKKNIELLPKTFPAFDIFQHKLVPKHEILSEEERQQLLAQYRVKAYQLPQIVSSDPAVKAIGALPGDVLRIIRKSPTAGEHIAFRYVIE